MLTSFLNAHPNIRADGEVFSKLNGRRHDIVLQRVFSRQPYYIAAKGFKLFYYHPLDADQCRLWRDLEQSNDLRVIHLKRRNILRTLISRKVADSQGIWKLPSSRRTGPSEKAAVTFTPAELEAGFEQTRRWELDGDKRFRNHKLMSIDYEDLVDAPSEVFGRITEFLGVGYAEPTTDLRKQNPGRLRDLVENYDDLKLSFCDTKWQTFFDE